MHFTDFFIRRPAFTLVVTFIMTIIGMVSYSNLTVRWIPNVTPPIVSISTGYPGASANLVENEITTPIEAALSGIDGVETLTSLSQQGESNITLNFKLGRNMNAVVEDVRSSLTRLAGALPRDATPPIVSKADIDSMAILYLAFTDKQRPPKVVSDYIEQFVVPRLQTVEGVAMVSTYGKRTSAMRVWLDSNKMAASHVSVEDVTQAITQQNVEVPSGRIRGVDRFYNVETNETLTNATQFNDLIVRNDQNQIVRLKNVGNAEVAPADVDSAFRVNSQPAIALGIIPQSTANPLAVSQAVLKTFADITQSLPAGMQSSVVYNEADFIKESVHSVYEALIEASIFVLFVIFLFLGNWRATLIPVVTIPVCLITTFALLSVFHFSINTITLMAFVLAIGLVVDDAIVMLENIARHIESGIPPFAAALKGSREIIFPIIAMTLTLAAVYTPIAFTSGLLGSIFSEFALTLAGAVLVSGVVALTLSPMMCSRLLVSVRNESRYQKWMTHQAINLQNIYAKILNVVLVKKMRVLLILVLIGLVGIGIYHLLPSELAPLEDRNEINVYVSAPHDASFNYTDSYVKKLEKIYANIPEAESYLADIGSGSSAHSFQVISLKPWYKRHRSAQQIATDLDDQFKEMTGVRVSASVPPPPLTWFGGSEGNSIEMAVMTAGNYKDLHQVMQNVIEEAKKFPGFSHVDSQLKWDREQFEVNIDREKIADLKIPMQSITNTISTLLAGKNVGKFEYGGKQYDITLQMDQSALSSPTVIPTLYVRTENNNMVSLADLTTIHETTTPGSLAHYERLRADTLFASLMPGYTIANAVTVLQKITQQILPDNMKIAFEGEARNYLESNNKMAFTFILALVFIYLVLVAQFESFIDPLVILLTVPFAVIGALIALALLGGSLNIYSNIGLVTLIGLIAKHGILITEFANRAMQAGKSIEEAIIEAAILRLRPILMTTSAMILGALPLALAMGAGAETRHQIGWVIVGGLFIGTFFSLIVVPVAYTFLARLKRPVYNHMSE
jgi:multidrug efflux pump